MHVQAARPEDDDLIVPPNGSISVLQDQLQKANLLPGPE